MLLGLLLGVAVMVLPRAATAAQAPVPLGSTATFGVLAGTTVTSTADTIIVGDLGVSTGTAVTGSHGVTGTMYLGDPTAAQAQSDLTIAYNDAAGRTVAPISVAGNLGGQTLAPGLYKSTSSLEISSGNLTLAGDANAVWIFQMVSTLVTTTGRQVILSGGAQGGQRLLAGGQFSDDWRKFNLQGNHTGGSIHHDGYQRNAGGPGAGPDRPGRPGRQSHYRPRRRTTSCPVSLSGSG
jgi:Ice-binding-like